MKPYRRDLKQLSRELRNDLTHAEQVLWHGLRRRQLLGLQFYRQKPLLDYIVDFYCPRAKLVIEVDGAHHLEVEYMSNDLMRDERLRSTGLQVLRFSNSQVLQRIESVIAVINTAVARELPG